MNQYIKEFWEAWNDPHARHAFLVHTPLVLGALGVFPLLGLAWRGFKSRPMRIVCITWFILMSGLAFMAEEAGEAAAGNLLSLDPPMTGAEARAIEHHEELGEDGWIWPLIPGVLTALTFIPKRPIRLGAGILGVIAAIGVSAWVAVTGHAGGRLVYVHGLGVPERTP